MQKDPIIPPTDPRVVELKELTELLADVPRLTNKQHRLVRELHEAGATPTELGQWIDRSVQRVWQIVSGGKAKNPRRASEATSDRNDRST